LAERARIVQAAAEEIAAETGVYAATAGTWRNRFAKGRIDGLYDEPRPGGPRQIGDEEVATTIRKYWKRSREARNAFLGRNAAKKGKACIGAAISTCWNRRAGIDVLDLSRGALTLCVLSARRD